MIYIVRHGQDEANAREVLNGHSDTLLTSLGRTQALAAAARLKDKTVRKIYASPLQRTQETATIISRQLGLPVEVHPALIERNFGVLTGRPFTDIPKFATKLLETEQIMYFLEAEGAETFAELHGRASKVLAELRPGQTDGNILLVTHGDTGMMLRAAHHGWTWERGLEAPYFGNAEIIELSVQL